MLRPRALRRRLKSRGLLRWSLLLLQPLLQVLLLLLLLQPALRASYPRRIHSLS
jgi:hypothetical protein